MSVLRQEQHTLELSTRGRGFVGILLVLEGILFAASPAFMRRAIKSALETPGNILRIVGIASALAGLILIWLVRR